MQPPRWLHRLQATNTYPNMKGHTMCIHCKQDTYLDKQANQRNHVWSDSPWCNMGRPETGDTVAERAEGNPK